MRFVGRAAWGCWGRWLGLLWLGLLWLTPAPAEAQAAEETSEAMDDEARLLFEAGRRAFADGRFEDALARFRESHRLTGRPQLLYNLGRALDALRRDAEALAMFEGYLAAVPEAENRREVESRIATLRGLLPAPEEGPPTTTPETAATPRSIDAGRAGTSRPHWAGALALGGLAVALVGVVPGVLALSTGSSLDDLCTADGACPERARDVLERGRLEAGAADVLFATGGALVLGFGLVWLLVEEPVEAPVTAWCGPAGCGALAGGRF